MLLQEMMMAIHHHNYNEADDDDDDKATLFDNLCESFIAVWHIPEEEQQRLELGFQVLTFGISNIFRRVQRE